VLLKLSEEIDNFPGLRVIECELFDDLSILNSGNSFINVLGMINNNVLSLIELINSVLTLQDVLINWKREPVVSVYTFLHEAIETFDFTLH
jgi:hypothetical protein